MNTPHPNGILQGLLEPSYFSSIGHDIAVSIIKNVLVDGVDPNSVQPNSPSPLYLSVKVESLELCKLLIEFGADPNNSGDSLIPMESCLCLAARKGNIDISRLLVDSGANVNPTPYRQSSEQFIPNPEIRQISSYFSGQKLKHLVKCENFDALAGSIESGNKDLCLFLISSGASLDNVYHWYWATDPNYENPATWKVSPYKMASWFGHKGLGPAMKAFGRSLLLEKNLQAQDERKKERL